MTHKYLFGATVAVFAFGVVTVGPAYAQRRDGGLLPQETSGDVTAVGCLVRGTAVKGGPKDKYVLARVKKGPVASVPEATCTVEPGADALTVDNPEKGKITDAALGRWVEITGRLERETDKDPDNLRELDVATFKLVPVVIPTPPAAAPGTGTTGSGSGTGTGPTGSGADGTRTSANPRAQEAAEDGEPGSRGWIGRIVLPCSRSHASFVPSPSKRLMPRPERVE